MMYLPLERQMSDMSSYNLRGNRNNTTEDKSDQPQRIPRHINGVGANLVLTVQWGVGSWHGLGALCTQGPRAGLVHGEGHSGRRPARAPGMWAWRKPRVSKVHVEPPRGSQGRGAVPVPGSGDSGAGAQASAAPTALLRLLAEDGGGAGPGWSSREAGQGAGQSSAQWWQQKPQDSSEKLAGTVAALPGPAPGHAARPGRISSQRSPSTGGWQRR